MSLTGSRCRQLEPISNGPDAKAHEYHLIMRFCPISHRARYVSAFPSITARCEDSAHQESCAEPRPIQARFHCLTGGLPPSVSDEPYLIIPVFHLDKGSQFIPRILPRRGTLPLSDNDVHNTYLFLNETKIRRWKTMKKESNMAVTAFTDRALRHRCPPNRLPPPVSLKPPLPRALIGNRHRKLRPTPG